MAKSSRSKWKKLHRRQRAKEEAVNTVKRIKQLHTKLELTVKGGISAVPPQEPEKRFHFLNPALDPRVPNTRKDLNNNYRAELNHVHYDYTKPLSLAPPKTNLYGKSDLEAPHPMTQNYESIDAEAPLGGHALTKADMERIVQKQLEAEATAAAGANEEEEHAIAHSSGHAAKSDDEAASDGPEEYVFGMDDAAPHRASSKKSAKKTAGTASKKAAGASAASSSGAIAAAVAAATSAAEEKAPQSAKGNKITSMQAMHKKHGVTVSTSGAAKMKKVGSQGGASGSRVVSSGGKAAAKRTGVKKVAK